ncbi:hypothetical protein BJV78DRAFT_1287361 [Lactifluus subvellereus]|nr:hypothetical protein BJV78DRAFT_1287361 [Lactifluus subvellereus]
MQEYELWCVIENKPIPFPVTVPTTKNVEGPQRFEDEKELYISQADLDNSTQLQDPSQLISEVWPTQPLNDHVHIYVMSHPSADQDTLRAARKLYDTLWGKDLNVILLDVPNGDGLKYVPRSQVNNLELHHLEYKEYALLIRKEYIFAFDALETRPREKIGGVVVSGQPGIGKSTFLFYALFRRLCAKKPTALQMSTCFVVFKDTGVKVHDPAILVDDALPTGTWALTDSNEHTREPCRAFLGASRQHQAWIVQATPPATDRWYQWFKELQAQYFVMERFSYEELIALGTILGLNLDHFREQIELWGSSAARTCILLTRDPWRTPHYIRLATNVAENLTSETCNFIHQSEKMADTQSHLLFSLRPMDAMRADIVGDIETKFLRNLVDNAIKRLDAAEQIEFYNLICKRPWFRASAGYVFAKLVYVWLTAHPTEEGLPCIAHSPEPPDPLQSIPVCKNVRVFSGTTAFRNAGNYETPLCWLPGSQAFPVTNAIICTDTHIITIQSTVSSRHEVNAEQFKKIQEAFPKSFRNARRWCHVFVTDYGEYAEALRDQVFTGLPDVEIYSAVLSIPEFRFTAEDLIRVEENKPDEMDTSEAEEGQASGTTGRTGVSADGPGGEQQVWTQLPAPESGSGR